MSLFSVALVVLASCQKVNVATELGGDLIPAVDNVTTFDTILSVQSFNFPFTTEDSSRSTGSNLQWLGRIASDPLFGTTQANMFFQLQPTTAKLPFAFTKADSLIGLDSVVLVLSYQGAYGDTNQAQQVQVFEMDQRNDFRGDTSYMIRENNFTWSNALSAVKTFTPNQLNDPFTGYREQAVNQLRIRLNDAFGNRLLRYDSTNAYLNDSAFNTYFKGFALVASGNGNGLVGINLNDTNTKLAFYYRYTKMGRADTAVTNFRFKPGNVVTAGGASANHIQRDYTGSELARVAGDQTADPLVYIQNAPGTYARVLVPALAGLTNRVVHRAELRVSQVPDLPLSNLLTPPSYLYLDAYDATERVYRTIPFDVTVGAGNQLNIAAFGMIATRAVSPAGTPIAQWRFNLTRYVQHVANRTAPAYEFRLYSPYLTRTNLSTSTTVTSLQANPVYGSGRVRVGGGSHPTQPMQLYVVYSKL